MIWRTVILLLVNVFALQMLYSDAAHFLDVIPYTPEQRVQVARAVRNAFEVISGIIRFT